jgi:hypothetical protein
VTSRAVESPRRGLWARLGNRWEHGHAGRFVVHLAGFRALVASVLAESARARIGDGGGRQRAPRGHLARHRAACPRCYNVAP